MLNFSTTKILVSIIIILCLLLGLTLFNNKVKAVDGFEVIDGSVLIKGELVVKDGISISTGEGGINGETPAIILHSSDNKAFIHLTSNIGDGRTATLTITTQDAMNVVSPLIKLTDSEGKEKYFSTIDTE